jgi:hypothetical protein
MKRGIKLLVLICCILQQQLASAQSAEFQQLVLNVEKLAQLKSVLANMKKTYDIISKGYGTIKDLSEGNFNLHQQFLDGLFLVSPEIRKYKKVPDIIRFQLQLVGEYKAALDRCRKSGQFTPQELDYMSKVYKNLFERSLQQLDELTMILTSGKLRMNDDERINGINRVYANMQGQLSQLRQFNQKTASLESHRRRANEEAATARTFRGLP